MDSILPVSLFVVTSVLAAGSQIFSLRPKKRPVTQKTVSKMTPALLLQAYKVNTRFGILSASEINFARSAVMKLRPTTVNDRKKEDCDLVFTSVDFYMPTKHEMMDALPAPVRRCAEVISQRVRTNETFVDIIDLSSMKLLKETVYDDRQPCISPKEYEVVEQMCREYKPLIHFMESKGMDPTNLRVDPWCVGYYDVVKDAPQERMAMPLLYYHDEDAGDEIPYCRPLEGLEIRVSLTRGKVVSFDHKDAEMFPLPRPAGELPNARYTPKEQQRKDLMPLEISQPQGPSFSITDGNRVRWLGWEFQVGWNSREALSLNLVTLNGRSLFHKLSVVEMVVPYGDPRHPHSSKAAFDAGEDGFGRNANSLKLGCDCLGHIEYLDAMMVGEDGAYALEQAVCIHEEDSGIAWKHTDWRTGEAEVRRGRRLVVSYITTIANYDYGFYWHLYLDGKVELDVKLTGVLSTGLYSFSDDGSRVYGASLGNSLYAPIHQHFFCARIDPVIDGPQNTVTENNVAVGLPPGSSDINSLGNAFYYTKTTLECELDATRDCNVSTQRTWTMESCHQKNFVGGATGYSLIPAPVCQPFGDLDMLTKQLGRATFLRHAMWVTSCEQDENYPGGNFPNQRDALDGLPLWTQRNNSLVNEDLVLWYNFGVTHQPRLEDFPVMPVEHTGFHMKPKNFFSQSPVMNLPSPSARGSSYGKCCSNKKKTAAAAAAAAATGTGLSLKEPEGDHGRASPNGWWDNEM